MREPEHRWPTAAAIEKLAQRFDLPTGPHMQDWEWEVADPNRIDEFLAAYKSAELDDDERFTLMEMLIQSFEDLEEDLETHPRWTELLDLLEENTELHASTIWYWGTPTADNDVTEWRVAPYLWQVVQRRRSVFER
jgi:hypothetical protein